MESNGKRGAIHISPDTAELLKSAGKGSWVKKRDNLFIAKGKGQVQTYWLNVFGNREESCDDGSFSDSSDDVDWLDKEEKKLSNKYIRLVGWNVETLLKLLKEIVARRNGSLRNFSVKRRPNEVPFEPARSDVTFEKFEPVEGKMAVQEIVEIITLPKFDRLTAMNQKDSSTIDLDTEVVEQLQVYITTVASLYNSNPCECEPLFDRQIVQITRDSQSVFSVLLQFTTSSML